MKTLERDNMIPIYRMLGYGPESDGEMGAFHPSVSGPRSGSRYVAVALLVTIALAGAKVATGATRRVARAYSPKTVRAVDAVVRRAIAEHDLGAVIVQITVNGRTLITKAYGDSMTGVPATTDMHFRSGAVAISYMSTLLLRLVDQHKVKLDDHISRWLPGFRDARQVTLRMLAGMTAGYFDYQLDPTLGSELNQNPFRQYSPSELIAMSLSKPQVFPPGTNWDYSHSDYVILGRVLQKITGQPLALALRDQVLGPLGLRHTANSTTAYIPAPVLHAFSSERRVALGIPPSTPFLEESTYWNPSWTLAKGAIETTDIADLTRTAIGIGEGKLLSRASYELQMAPNIGFGHPQPGCVACRRLSRLFGYGLGVVRNGSWVLQNPLFGGYGAVEAYNPGKKISIAVVTTFRNGSFDARGDITNYAATLYSQLGALLAPDDPPPTS